jgi:hypothetical protein
VSHLYIKTPSFYQDRLGTNIRKNSKTSTFFLGGSSSGGGGGGGGGGGVSVPSPSTPSSPMSSLAGAPSLGVGAARPRTKTLNAVQAAAHKAGSSGAAAAAAAGAAAQPEEQQQLRGAAAADGADAAGDGSGGGRSPHQIFQAKATPSLCGDRRRWRVRHYVTVRKRATIVVWNVRPCVCPEPVLASQSAVSIHNIWKLKQSAVCVTFRRSIWIRPR